MPLWGVRIKIFRWAPGFLGAQGSGGGEAFLTLPTTGDVAISIEVLDKHFDEIPPNCDRITNFRSKRRLETCPEQSRRIEDLGFQFLISL